MQLSSIWGLSIEIVPSLGDACLESGISYDIKSLRVVGQAAEFKFESKFDFVQAAAGNHSRRL